MTRSWRVVEVNVADLQPGDRLVRFDQGAYVRSAPITRIVPVYDGTYEVHLDNPDHPGGEVSRFTAGATVLARGHDSWVQRLTAVAVVALLVAILAFVTAFSALHTAHPGRDGDRGISGQDGATGPRGPQGPQGIPGPVALVDPPETSTTTTTIPPLDFGR